MAIVKPVEIQGTLKHTPRVLLVDDSHHSLTGFKHSLQDIQEAGCVPVIHHCVLDAGQSGKTLVGFSGMTPDDIIAYAKDPANGIDIVLTGNRSGNRHYGAEILKGLKETLPPFQGQVAIQTKGEVSPVEDKDVRLRGGVGVFELADMLEPQGALAAALAVHGKSRGIV